MRAPALPFVPFVPFVACALVLVLAGCPPAEEQAPDGGVDAGPSEVHVQLLGFNDLHGHLEPPEADPPLGGAAFLATHLAQLRARNARTVVVAAGDLIGASPFLSALFHDEATLEALASMGLDASSFGNHELDEGKAEALRVVGGGCHPVDGCVEGSPWGGTGFQYLAANVIDTDTGAPLFQPTYLIKDLAPVRVAFIGVTLEGTASHIGPIAAEGLSFRDEVETVNALVPEIQAQGVEAIVVLIHEGGDPSGDDPNACDIDGPILDIVRGFDAAVDVVVSGHTHKAYVCEVDGRLVTSAKNFGRFVTALDLTIDVASGDVTAASAENIAVTRDVEPDAAVTAIIDRHLALAAPFADRVVGHLAEPLTLAPTDAGETALGDVIADAQLAATSDALTGGAHIAFIGLGGLRAELLPGAAGAVTHADVFTVQPFSDLLWTMTLTGAQLEALLEGQFFDGFAAVWQVSSSLRYRWDASGTDGARIDPAAVFIDGEALDLAADYRVTVNNFDAAFSVFPQGIDVLEGVIDTDAFETYLAAHDPLEAPPLDRISVAP